MYPAISPSIAKYYEELFKGEVGVVLNTPYLSDKNLKAGTINLREKFSNFSSVILYLGGMVEDRGIPEILGLVAGETRMPGWAGLQSIRLDGIRDESAGMSVR